MALGGAGFVSKSEPPEVLLSTLADVAAGRMVFPFVDVRLLNEAASHVLTPREVELLRALPRARPIGHRLASCHLLHTVKFHLKNIYAKLQASNRAQAFPSTCRPANARADLLEGVGAGATPGVVPHHPGRGIVRPHHPGYVMSSIAVTGLTKRWGSVAALRGIDFEARAGELVVLLGPSGCGKSTTLRIIAGLEEATSGTIRFGERDVTALPAAQRGIAMVFQSYALYPTCRCARTSCSA
jgi:ABC-type multidrug transport system fused ATPase/permease subunit